MISRSERFPEMRCAILANLDQPVRKAHTFRAPQAVEALTHGFSNRRRHAFPGQRRKFLRQPMRLLILDVQSHSIDRSTITCYHSTSSRDLPQCSTKEQFPEDPA